MLHVSSVSYRCCFISCTPAPHLFGHPFHGSLPQVLFRIFQTATRRWSDGPCRSTTRTAGRRGPCTSLVSDSETLPLSFGLSLSMRELSGSGELGVVSQLDKIPVQLTAIGDGAYPDFDLSAPVAVPVYHSLLLLLPRMRPALKSSAFGEGRLMHVWAECLTFFYVPCFCVAVHCASLHGLDALDLCFHFVSQFPRTFKNNDEQTNNTSLSQAACGFLCVLTTLLPPILFTLFSPLELFYCHSPTIKD